MKLIVKNHLFKMVVCDLADQPLYQIKSFGWSAKKLIETVNNKILYSTDIIDSKASPVSEGCFNSRQYMVQPESQDDECSATASLGYAISSNQQTMRWFPNRVPQVDQLKVQIHSPQNLNLAIHLLKDDSCLIYNEQNQILGKISSYHLFKGYVMESDAISDGGMLCALFVLTRYMIKENEFIIV